jgi:hypothetical protein
MLYLRLLWDNIHTLLAVNQIVHHNPIGSCEQGIVLAGADVQTGFDLGTALADEDVSGQHELTRVPLYA